MGRSPEALLLLAALRGDERGAAPQAADAASRVDDWDAFVALCARHGVSAWALQGLTYAGLADLLPPSAAAMLRDDARASAVEALALAPALEEALLALAAAGVPAMVLKGPAIAERHYPDPALRPYRDIDLLVPASVREQAAGVCERLGYEVIEDHGGAAAAAPGSAEAQFETLYRQRTSGAYLDLHFDHLQFGLRPRGLPGLWRRAEPWSFLGAPCLVPGANDLFLLLTVHLHRHGFERLIWLKDLDLMVRNAALDWDWLASAAREEGVTASLAQSLRMLRELLGTPLPAEAARLARAGMLPRLLWRESDILNGGGRRGRWRRAVQFAPQEGLRGALPSLLLMGRRREKTRALWRRAMRRRTPVDAGEADAGDRARRTISG